MIRKLLAALGFACALLGAGPARAWNSGTHVYIADQLLKSEASNPRLIIDAEYGASVLDLFGNDFTPPAVYLSEMLHDPNGDLFMNVWDVASARRDRALAYGLVSHNNAWGADATAHISGLTSGQGVGWVIARGEILGAMLDPFLQQAGIVLPPSQLTDVGHFLVEQAVDLLMLEVDRSLGAKVMASAAAREKKAPFLLQAAWSDAFASVVGSPEAASQMIFAYEDGLREYLMAYGWALMQPNAIELLASQTAVIAEGYLGLPPGSAAPLVPLIESGILAGMQLCAPDFQQEIAATVEWVGANMAAHGVTY
ncbi:MAG TPA: hypothetical protein VFF02_11190 [Anaeromyxobacteraceae bacterium]|nr:hypothetical protein [Anaeromyxobacteraceae bacterium]